MATIAETYHLGTEIGQTIVDDRIEAVVPFHSEESCGAYIVTGDSEEQLKLLRWEEEGGFTWRRELEFSVFISLSVSAGGGLVAACAWEDESVLGFVFDEKGILLERTPLDPLSHIEVLPDGSNWNIAWAMFDWLGSDASQCPVIPLAPECSVGAWSKKILNLHSALWWYRPRHHPGETAEIPLCFSAFALTDDDDHLLFAEQEDASFVTLFADVVSSDGKLVLVKEGEDAQGNQARQMIAMTGEGEVLWKVAAPRQSSQVSGFIGEDDFVLLFAGKDFEVRNASTGAFIASDTLKISNRQRLFPIQGFLRDDENFLALGRQFSVSVALQHGEGILDCSPLEIGGALSFDRRLCALYSTSSDSSARVFELFWREE